MSNIYLGFHFTIEPKELGSEILIAELGELPFESFIEMYKKSFMSKTVLMIYLS
jgi:hypothetical protein